MSTRDSSEISSALRAGSLSHAQADLVLRALPLDFSVMDAQGTIVFWQGAEFADCDRRFIGRPAEDCHSQRSQAMIRHMVEEFRAGRRDEAVFVSRDNGRTVISRYVPLRDEKGGYCGILETMQDVTGLEGLAERHDLNW